MANSVAFLCSITLLIVLLSYTDGQWNLWNGWPMVERRNDERQNDMWNDERQNDMWNDERRNDMWNDERRNDDMWNEESQINEKWNDERRNDERWNDERWNDERWNNEIGIAERSNGERRNSERSKDERGNNGRSKDERWNNERLDNERWNNNRLNNGKSNNERSNDKRRSNERSDNERRNNERSNKEGQNDERFNNEKRNDERRKKDRLPSIEEKCPADKKVDWSYRGNNGALMWTRNYSECGGQAQSPVAINSYEALFDEDIEKLKLHKYHILVERATIENNGHTIQITPRDDVQRVINFDGSTYKLRQLHFHWGNDKSHGSEHSIDFTHYALEMHLVHQSDAGRLAVVAVFFREQGQTNKELQNIIQNFPKLTYKDNSTELKSPINLNNLIPVNPASFYWYEGSLTTPPCTEGVQWLLLTKIMAVGTKQMSEFRKLYSSSKADCNEYCKISNNYRPLQSLNGRTVVFSQ